MDPAITAFFTQYQRASAIRDFPALGELYAETFMFAGPNSVHAVKREDFLKIIPRRKEQFVSLGVMETALCSAESFNLDSRYVLAKVTWKISLRVSNGSFESLEVTATYILQRGTEGKMWIVFQLDHQDLAAVVAQATSEAMHSS